MITDQCCAVKIISTGRTVRQLAIINKINTGALTVTEVNTLINVCIFHQCFGAHTAGGINDKQNVWVRTGASRT